MTQFLGLPEIEHLVFKETPLVLTVCQVQFSTVLEISQPSFIAPFQRALQKHYPLLASTDQVAYEVGIGPGEPEIRQGEKLRQWRFSDIEDNWAVVLSHDFVALETRKYAHFEDFLTRLRSVIKALTKHVRPAVGTRIGLRYINEIRPGHQDWQSVINRELLGPLANPNLSQNITHSIQEIRFSLPNQQSLAIRHGSFPGGTTVHPKIGESVSLEPFYLLDLDAFHDFQLPNILPMEVDIICRYVVQYHHLTYQLFRWSVTEQYISTLGVQNL